MIELESAGAAEAGGGAEAGSEAGYEAPQAAAVLPGGEAAGGDAAGGDAEIDLAGLEARHERGEALSEEEMGHLQRAQAEYEAYIAELEARHERGDELADEEMEFYSSSKLAGGRPLPAAKANAEPSGLELAMRELGAKDAEEMLPKVREFRRQISMKGETVKRQESAIAAMRQQIEELQGRILQAEQQAPEAPSEGNESGYDPDMLFLDGDKGRAFMEEYGQLKRELDGMKERFGNYEQAAKQREQKALRAEVHSELVDEMLELATLYGEDYGLGSAPARSMIEQCLQNSGSPDPGIDKLFETLLEYNKGAGRSLKEAHKLLNFDRYGEKLAKARMGAVSDARKTLFNAKKQYPGAAAAQSAPSMAESDLESMKRMEKDMPGGWFDEDGFPDEAKMPPQALAAWYGRNATIQ